jgi:hypothetical protein
MGSRPKGVRAMKKIAANLYFLLLPKKRAAAGEPLPPKSK